MRNELLVNFSNYDYIVTGFNGTLEEAKDHYLNNTFTDVNEKSIQVVNVWLYDEFKADVLQHCLDSEIIAVKFNDDKQLFTFKTKYNDLVTLSYEKTKHVLNRIEGWTYSDYFTDGWNNSIFETKEKAIAAAKDKFKNTNSRFVEIGFLVKINNQLNVIKTEKLVF